VAHPLGALLGQDVPPMGSVPFEGPSGITLEAFGRSAIGLDLRHLFFLTPLFLSRVSTCHVQPEKLFLPQMNANQRKWVEKRSF